MHATFVIEDDVHLHIIHKVLKRAPHIIIGRILGRRGNQYIKSQLHSFNEASLKVNPYIILTDLDSIECAPKMNNDWFPFSKSPKLLFNIAVREGEAWLLADRKNFARFFGVSASSIDRDVEGIPDPKLYIVNLARQSRKRTIREGIVPDGTAKVGKLYNTILEEFIQNTWDVSMASNHSNSLDRFIQRLNSFVI